MILKLSGSRTLVHALRLGAASSLLMIKPGLTTRHNTFAPIYQTWHSLQIRLDPLLTTGDPTGNTT